MYDAEASAAILAILIAGGVILVPVLLLRAGNTKVVKYIALLVEVLCWGAIAVSVALTALTLRDSLFYNRTRVTVLLTPSIPQLMGPAEMIDAPLAHIVEGGADRATMVLTQLTIGTRMTIATASVVLLAVVVTLGILIAKMARNLRLGQPFHRLSGLLLIAAVVLFVGFTGWSVLDGLGSWLAGQEALAPGWMYAIEGMRGMEVLPSDFARYGWLSPADWTLTINIWPLLCAMALAILGVIFRSGEKLQQDTEGLV